MNMDFQDGIEIIFYAMEQKMEEIIYQRWLIGYEKFMSLDEFKQKLSAGIHSNVQYKEEPVESILEKVKGIINLVNRDESI